jgi:hypothetical protein
MMLHFSPAGFSRPREPEWPDFKLKEPATPFSPRPPLQALRVVVDFEILAAAASTENDFTPTVLLAGLVTHPYIRLLRYADAGPPDDLPRRNGEPFTEPVDGWVLVKAPKPQEPATGFIPVVGSDGRSVMQACAGEDFVRAAESDDRTGAYTELDPGPRAERRRADVLAAQAAHALHAHLFITERPYLHAATWQFADGVLVASPRDALPLISLYLRSQNQYYTWRSIDGTGSSTMNRGLFYWVGTRELLPAGWRWFAACVQHAYAVHNDRVIYLAPSLVQRVQRALQARDDAHRSLNLPQDNDTAAAALDGLDQVILALMGAVDVTARIAHMALPLDPNRTHDAGWQRQGWLKQVKKAHEPLGALMAPGARHRHVLTILSSLRNSVHGAALDALAIGDGRRRDATLVGLPHADGEKLVQAMDSCGGRESWGVQKRLRDRYHAEPGVLLERIFRGVIALLNDVQAATPVENLAGVRLAESDAYPPEDGGFEPMNRASIRWQLGL